MWLVNRSCSSVVQVSWPNPAGRSVGLSDHDAGFRFWAEGGGVGAWRVGVIAGGAGGY